MIRDGFSEGVTRESEEPATRREHFRLKKSSGVEVSLACGKNSKETPVVGDHEQRVG